MPSSAQSGATASAATAIPKTADGHTDFSGVYELAKMELVVLPEVAGQMTDAAKARADLFRSKFSPVDDDPAKVCMIKGMPWTMLSRARNYPVQIYQYPDRFFVQLEIYDQFRVITVNGAPKPDSYPNSPNGWSVARWDGPVLEIVTTGLIDLNEMGIAQRTEDARITERWTIRNDPEFGQVIDIEMAVDDPAIFKTPARARQVWKRSEPGVVPGGYNCSKSLWDTHIEDRMKELGIQP